MREEESGSLSHTCDYAYDKPDHIQRRHTPRPLANLRYDSILLPHVDDVIHSAAATAAAASA